MAFKIENSTFITPNGILLNDQGSPLMHINKINMNNYKYQENSNLYSNPGKLINKEAVDQNNKIKQYSQCRLQQKPQKQQRQSVSSSFSLPKKLQNNNINSNNNNQQHNMRINTVNLQSNQGMQNFTNVDFSHYSTTKQISNQNRILSSIKTKKVINPRNSKSLQKVRPTNKQQETKQIIRYDDNIIQQQIAQIKYEQFEKEIIQGLSKNKVTPNKDLLLQEYQQSQLKNIIIQGNNQPYIQHRPSSSIYNQKYMKQLSSGNNQNRLLKSSQTIDSGAQSQRSQALTQHDYDSKIQSFNSTNDQGKINSLPLIDYDDLLELSNPEQIKIPLDMYEHYITAGTIQNNNMQQIGYKINNPKQLLENKIRQNQANYFLKMQQKEQRSQRIEENNNFVHLNKPIISGKDVKLDQYNPLQNITQQHQDVQLIIQQYQESKQKYYNQQYQKQLNRSSQSPLKHQNSSGHIKVTQQQQQKSEKQYSCQINSNLLTGGSVYQEQQQQQISPSKGRDIPTMPKRSISTKESQENQILDQIIQQCTMDKYILTQNNDFLDKRQQLKKQQQQQQLLQQNSRKLSPAKQSPTKLVSIERQNLISNSNNKTNFSETAYNPPSQIQNKLTYSGNNKSGTFFRQKSMIYSSQQLKSRKQLNNEDSSSSSSESDGMDYPDHESDGYESPQLRCFKKGATQKQQNSESANGKQNQISTYSTQNSSSQSNIPSNKIGAISKQVTLLRSVYEGRPHTILFPYPQFCDKVRNQARTIQVTEEEAKKFNLNYQINNFTLVSGIEYTLSLAGFQLTEDEQDWNLLWGIGQHKKIKDMNKYQKTNHFPGCYNLGRKDFLWRHLSKLKRKYPKDYNYVPNTYILSSTADWDKFISEKEVANKNHLWIMKPCGSAQGKGIKILSKRSKVKKDRDCLICEYVANPHLINGLKYDLRIYVLVTSYNPLRVYIYDEGLVRFASEKYSSDLSQLQKKYVHLTNYAINKLNKNFVKNEDPEKDNVGNKWSLAALKKHFLENNLDFITLSQQMNDLIVKTCIACEPHMSDIFLQCGEHRKNCFELYGFDILIDDNLKPWLLEVNVQPSLRSSSPLDRKIKHSLMSDVFNLIGLQPYDKDQFDNDTRKKIPGVGRGEAPFKSRNFNEVKDINIDNCLYKLQNEDWNILFETDEEYYRKGHFYRAFPISPEQVLQQQQELKEYQNRANNSEDNLTSSNQENTSQQNQNNNNIKNIIIEENTIDSIRK